MQLQGMLPSNTKHSVRSVIACERVGSSSAVDGVRRTASVIHPTAARCRLVIEGRWLALPPNMLSSGPGASHYI